MIVVGEIKPAVTERCCPKCGYLISNIQAACSRFDFECQKCKEHKVSEFQPLKKWVV